MIQRVDITPPESINIDTRRAERRARNQALDHIWEDMNAAEEKRAKDELFVLVLIGCAAVVIVLIAVYLSLPVLGAALSVPR